MDVAASQGFCRQRSVVQRILFSYVVVWHGNTDASGGTEAYDIFYRRVDVAGAPLGGPETLVNVASGQQKSAPAVTALPEGGFVAAWYHPDARRHKIFSRGFSAAYVGDESETAVKNPASGM